MQQSHKNAEEKYTNIRTIAYELTMDELPYQDRAAIKITDINNIALTSSRAWALSGERRVHWDWTFGVKTYRKRYPNRFELAIWYGGYLCGLALGRPSYNATRVRLDFIERVPGENNPLKGRVTPISTTAFEVYARLVDAAEVRIMFPDVNLIEYYSSLGYAYVQGTGSDNNPDYLFKKL